MNAFFSVMFLVMAVVAVFVYPDRDLFWYCLILSGLSSIEHRLDRLPKRNK